MTTCRGTRDMAIHGWQSWLTSNLVMRFFLSLPAALSMMYEVPLPTDAESLRRKRSEGDNTKRAVVRWFVPMHQITHGLLTCITLRTRKKAIAPLMDYKHACAVAARS